MAVIWKEIEFNPRHFGRVARAKWPKLTQEMWNASFSRALLIRRLDELYERDTAAEVDAWLASLSPAPDPASTIGAFEDHP